MIINKESISPYYLEMLDNIREGGFDILMFNKGISIDFDDGSNVCLVGVHLILSTDRYALYVYTEHNLYQVFPLSSIIYLIVDGLPNEFVFDVGYEDPQPDRLARELEAYLSNEDKIALQ